MQTVTTIRLDIAKSVLHHAISAATSTGGAAVVFSAPTAMTAATATSIRPYAFDLSSLQLSAASRTTTALRKAPAQQRMIAVPDAPVHRQQLKRLHRRRHVLKALPHRLERRR